MTTLYIRLFSRAAAEQAEPWSTASCAYAVAEDAGGGRLRVAREGQTQLVDLIDVMARARQVVLLLAPSDVTLLQIKVPPMSAARLKVALPNLVEEHLMGAVDECVIVAGAPTAGTRTVAVVQQDWLEKLRALFDNLGARQLQALPSQLCLPWEAGTVSAALMEEGSAIELTLRLGEQAGMGLAIEPASSAEAPAEVLATLDALVPEQAIVLYVRPEQAELYQSAAQAAGWATERLSVQPDDWSRWLVAASQTRLDLMPGLAPSGSTQFNWRPWRWPLVLGGLLVATNVAALNIEWLRLKGEADDLRASLTQIYRTAYPRDTVVVDPVAQMRQKIVAAKGGGQGGPNGFSALTAGFAQAWQQAVPQGQDQAIAALEYREGSLLVRLKPDAPDQAEAVQAALLSQQLALEVTPAEDGSIVWTIRSSL